MKYSIQWYIAVGLQITTFISGAVVVAGVALGLDLRTITLIGLVGAASGFAQGFFPKVQKPPDPERKGMD